MSNTLLSSIEEFFTTFKPGRDPRGAKKMILSESLKTFLAAQTKDNAYDVYRAFLDVYNFKGKPFIDLFCVLWDYEENAAALTDNQLDRFTHGVNVFILGLAVYARNEHYSSATDGFLSDMLFNTHKEEFFFRWGIAALFHDIGSPLEIIGNQLKEYIHRIANNDRKTGSDIGAHIAFLNPGKLNSLKLSDIQIEQASSITNMGADIFQQTDLLAYNISTALDIPFESLSRVLYNYLFTMQQDGFIDHGYYSALITLKWYGEILNDSEFAAKLFFTCVLDSAAAILLHNAYRSVLMKAPFYLPPLKAEKFPISYLLLLCNEVLDWNSGKSDMSGRTNVMVDEQLLKLHYVTPNGLMNEDRIEAKKARFSELLDIESIFPSGITITTTTLEEKIEMLRESDEITPRLLLQDLDQLARRIFDDYNDKQRTRNPEEALKYPEWDSAPDTIKYSNYNQARDLVNKVNILGYHVSDEGEDIITSFSAEQVEQLSRHEHQRWVEERLQNGWVYGKERDVEKKVSPYIVPYENLTEDIKELDRDAVRNIIPLLNSVGLKVLKSGAMQPVLSGTDRLHLWKNKQKSMARELSGAQRYRKLTILHSNDIHGDFLPGNVDEELLGGISMLSGYVLDVKKKDPEAIYCIAGDMLQGSLIDSEFKGISTIEIMNMLAPDIVTLGNHEIDYGLAHLLFLERCAKFPIVNANLFIKNPYTRLFNSHKIMKVNGMDVLFIGIITKQILDGIKMDNLLSSLIDVAEAAREVGRICNSYRTTDINLTVLLTHIGFEEDKQLAALLNPSWGVDLIIGGHSHTILEKPEVVNDVKIVQAGMGTKQLGHLDIVVDTGLNTIHSYDWRLVPIDSQNCPRDTQMEDTIHHFKRHIDEKYDRILCRFQRTLTHPDRYRETELGNLIADAMKDSLGVDLFILGSGSLRKKQAGPVLTYGGLKELLPFDDRVYSLQINGAQLRSMLAYLLREELPEGGHGEFYQFSRGLGVTYNRATQRFDRFEFAGQTLEDTDVLRVGLQAYHYSNLEKFFGISTAELVDGKGAVITTSQLDVLEEYFISSQHPDAQVEGRLVVIS